MRRTSEHSQYIFMLRLLVTVLISICQFVVLVYVLSLLINGLLLVNQEFFICLNKLVTHI